MAETFLEAIGVLQGFGLQYLFVPMLVFVIVFGVLARTQAISDKLDVNAVIALVVAILIALNPIVSSFFYYFLPIVTVFMLIFFAGILIFLFFGASTKDVTFFLTRSPSWIFFIVMVFVFFIMSMLWAFPSSFYPTTPGGEGMIMDSSNITVADIAGPNAFMIILANPRTIGLITFMLLIGIIATVVVYQRKG